jgi:hypothetical protein
MRLLASGIEHALDVPMHCPHHGNPGMHQEIPALCGLDQDVTANIINQGWARCLPLYRRFSQTTHFEIMMVVDATENDPPKRAVLFCSANCATI